MQTQFLLVTACRLDIGEDMSYLGVKVLPNIALKNLMWACMLIVLTHITVFKYGALLGTSYNILDTRKISPCKITPWKIAPYPNPNPNPGEIC